MGIEIDLLVNYPKTKRNLSERAASKTEEDRAIARQFGRDFFDGDRRHGYGGFSYHPRFWQPVIPTFVQHFGIGDSSSILDVGCGKGFMLFDMQQLIPGVKVAGVDISAYAVENSLKEVKNDLQVADARKLPFEDKSFDYVISINTIHNLERNDLILALKEIERVAAKGSFVTVDAYRNEEERLAMEAWNLTAKTILSVDDWKKLFAEAGYTGDYFWFIP